MKNKIVIDPSIALRTNSKLGIRIAVGMSGGVDSSVSALLLKQAGYEVVGLFMKLWHPPRLAEGETGDPCGTGENACCDEKALADAHAVAQKIGIKLYVVDARQEFKEAVTDYFIDEYKNCHTPNPCVVCNKKIKFGRLLDFAKKIGCDYLATGHYARIECHSEAKPKNLSRSFANTQDDKQYSLLKAKDSKKDQSYFLYRLNQEQLSHIIFPLGDMTKAEVRKIAKEAGLPVHEKKESQEICFVEDNYRSFLKRSLGENAFRPGNIVDKEGNVIGKHDGLINYTIGQRKGIEQSQKWKVKSRREKQPLYVLGFDRANNLLIVGEDQDLRRSEFELEDVHWISDPSVLNQKMNKLAVKIRYGAKAVPCRLARILNFGYKVELNQPARALTPGQSAVFYSDDEIRGGGIIRA